MTRDEDSVVTSAVSNHTGMLMNFTYTLCNSKFGGSVNDRTQFLGLCTWASIIKEILARSDRSPRAFVSNQVIICGSSSQWLSMGLMGMLQLLMRCSSRRRYRVAWPEYASEPSLTLGCPYPRGKFPAGRCRLGSCGGSSCSDHHSR